MSSRKLLVLIALVLVLAIGASAAIWLTHRGGTQVVVSVGGKVCGRYDLSKDQTIVIQPDSGRWHNTLVISGGTARITESDCANQICVKSPPLTEDTIGMIVCLPHGLVVELQ